MTFNFLINSYKWLNLILKKNVEFIIIKKSNSSKIIYKQKDFFFC